MFSNRTSEDSSVEMLLCMSTPLLGLTVLRRTLEGVAQFSVPGGTFHWVFGFTIKLNLSMCEWFLLETVLTPYWF